MLNFIIRCLTRRNERLRAELVAGSEQFTADIERTQAAIAAFQRDIDLSMNPA